MGRAVGWLLAALVLGVGLQAWLGSRLEELEAPGAGATPEALEQARGWLRAVTGATFGASLGLSAALGWLSLRTLRARRFPPPDADWLGARRHYEGASARRVGWLGLALAALLAGSSLAGLLLVWALPLAAP